MTYGPLRQVIFFTPFNVHDLSTAVGTQRWTDERFRFWETYTCPSILRQSQAGWLYWLLCSDRRRHLTEPLRHRIRDPRVRLVYESEQRRVLSELETAEGYAIARLDSDDVYHPEVCHELAQAPTNRPFLQYNRGFALDLRSGRLVDWIARSPPFYARVYGPELRTLGTWEAPNHQTVSTMATILETRRFLVLCHQLNTSTRIRRRGPREYRGAERDTILSGFGLDLQSRRSPRATFARGARSRR